MTKIPSPQGFEIKAAGAIVLSFIVGFCVYFAPAGLNMHGVVVGMTESEVQRKLGKPASVDGTAWMYYFGPMVAGAEFLEVDFSPNHRVIAICGEQLSRGWRGVSAVTDTESKITKDFGPPRKRVQDGKTVRYYVDNLEFFLTDDQVTSITLR